MIVNYVSKSEFRDEFAKMNRKDNFSYEGLGSLYDWLEEYYEEADKPYELDVIELCCDFTEYDNLEEFNKYYNREYENIDDIVDDTILIRVDNTKFIIQNF
tara:strand:- start:138 stop:440 length:303 start_codon:yes stop_codon:yes gene_type:complete